MSLLAHSKMAHCKITSKASLMLPYTITNRTIRANCNYKDFKCTCILMYSLEIIKFVVELWHNWNNYGHNIQHNGWFLSTAQKHNR